MKLVVALTAHRGPVTALSYNSQNLLCGSSDSTISVFSPSNNYVYMSRLYGHAARGLSSIQAVDDVVVMGSDDGIFISDTKNVSLLKITTEAPVTSVAMTDQYVVAGSADATVRLYERASGTQLAIYRGHEGAVLAVTVNKDVIVSGGQDGKITFYNYKGMTLRTLRTTGPVSSVQLSPNGGFLAAVSMGVAVQVYKIGDKVKLVRSFEIKEDRYLHQCCFFGRKVAFGGCGRVVVFDIQTQSTEEIVVEGEDFLAIAATDTEIAAGSRQARVWIIK